MTSVLAVSDLIFKNLLAELNLNPVWETWRGYFFAASIVCTLIPFYLTINGLNLHCVPEHPEANHSTIAVLSSSQTAYVNTVCSVNELFIPRYCGAFMLCMVVMIIMVSSYWLHIRDVADGFRTFNEAREKLRNLVLPQDEMNRLCSNVIVELSEQHQTEDFGIIKTTCLLLSFLRRNDNVYIAYLIRCTACGLTLLCFIGFSTYLILQLAQQTTQRFSCDLGNSEIDLELGNAFNYSFNCAANEATILATFVTVFAVTLFLQIILICYGIVALVRYLQKSSEKRNKYDQDGSHGPEITKWKTLSLMIVFEDSARPVKNGVLKDLLQHLFVAQRNFITQQNLHRILEDDNYDILKNYVDIFGPIPEMIGCLNQYIHWQLQEHFCDSGPPQELGSAWEEKCVKAMKASQYSLHHAAVNGCVETLCKFKHWELLVILVENSDLKKGTENSSDILKNVPLFERSKFGSQDPILYYAFGKDHSLGPVKFATAKLLCQGTTLENLEHRSRGVISNTRSGHRCSPTTFQTYLKTMYSPDEHRDLLKEMEWRLTDKTRSNTPAVNAEDVAINMNRTRPAVDVSVQMTTAHSDDANDMLPDAVTAAGRSTPTPANADIELGEIKRVSGSRPLANTANNDDEGDFHTKADNDKSKLLAP